MTAQITTTLLVAGMTCGHCVSAVTAELAALPGVGAVDVDLVPGGDSPVTVTSDGALDIPTAISAIADAGYVADLAPRQVDS